MPEPVEIAGIPNRDRAEAIAETMRNMYPNWTVQIIGNSPPFTVRRTPPSRGSAAPNAVVVGSEREGILGFLDFIAEYESTGNYNAVYGHASNSSNPRLTDMTIDEVLEWQKSRSYTAAGKYQIIRKTLQGLKNNLDLDGSKKYDEAMQDLLATELLNGRGLQSFLDGNLPREDFAESVSKEWAALPRVKPPNPHLSYYDGDGVNAARVDVPTYIAAIDRLMNSQD